MNVNFEVFNSLLQAPSKSFVDDLLQHVALDTQTTEFTSESAKALNLSVPQMKTLCEELKRLIRFCLFEGVSDKRVIAKLFPSDFHQDLKKLLCIVISRRFEEWNTADLKKIVSIPRLEDMEWTVTVPSASSEVAKISYPSILLHLKLKDGEKSEDVEFELSKEALQTMLSGLGRIREQLSGIH
eukprot:TRINITY_DN1444_c2_g1_i1.p1 TRINITY_DN1444_c2_g1~~TRINITY_DN1444_c2_g1_i1.p1  ORF type:complete len:184 (-),score=47.93 TRINITY_DN1444_c2_g1_i1:104-655(-)